LANEGHETGTNRAKPRAPRPTGQGEDAPDDGEDATVLPLEQSAGVTTDWPLTPRISKLARAGVPPASTPYASFG
jgi:hypothetical protein